ncbi:thioredoxin family protein [Pseudoruegeria sp. SHC-113]|uniref:thioredoxin family protein n=1 Tax=Pseudoruegeria sp. SHC-113 TaxID=2855439 RepID=UPI0021BAB6CD|nr:thioredoxin [Pseudoruegeria sp. SHC-113]MCT8158725.1 thioredoxin family protein [Pseudoruegeria sp. SHC-113]
MDRRAFLFTTAAALTLPHLAFAAPVNYTPGLVEKELAAGKTVFLDFKAEWCSTCKAQERVIAKLLAENPAYAANISFINIDWDEYRSAKITKDLKIPRRSTLVVLRGDKELGRIVAGVSRKDIQALMDTALAAATA